MKFYPKLASLFVLISTFLLSYASAGELEIPHSFSPGDIISSTEMNDNFNAIKTEVDDNANAIVGIESLIVAYGVIGFQGNIIAGNNIESCQWNSTNGWYEITLAGENYYYEDYVTLVTPITGQVTFNADSLDGRLIVEFLESDGSESQNFFNFLTLKP